MKFEKVMKKLSASTFEEMDMMDEAGLNKAIAQAEENISVALKEKDKNSRYQDAKSIVSDFNSATKDVKDYQGAKIAFALVKLKLLANDDSIAADVIDFIEEARSRAKKSSKA